MVISITRDDTKIKTTYNHLLHLILYTHPADDLHVLHAAQNLVLDLETGFHAEGGAFLDCEGMLVEVFKRARLGQVDDDVGSAFYLQAQREDDDFAWVLGV